MAYYQPYTFTDLSYTEGILNIFFSSVIEKIQITIHFPKTSISLCNMKNILLGSGDPEFPMFFKQLKMYKGGFLNSSKNDQCHVFISPKSFKDYTKGYYSIASDCLLPKPSTFYNEATNSFNKTSNLTEFCVSNTSRLSISGQEISRCEKCAESSPCPEAGICKDSFVQITYEECDDGLDDSQSLCSHYCNEPKPGYKCNTIINKTKCDAICGDGIWIKDLEECDDKNLQNNDGCDVNCKIEGGYICEENQEKYSKCFKCVELCARCENNTCVKCQSDYFLYQGKCYAACPKGALVNETTLTCYDCKVKNCAKCYWLVYSGESHERCHECDENYFLINNVTCNTTCPIDGYYIPKSGHCSSCPKNCSECFLNSTSDLVKCSSCLPGYFFFLGDCVNKCEEGYYFDGITCQKCSENCLKCSDEKSCIKCDQNYVLSTEDSCNISCKEHQYNSSGVCKECNPECKTCENQNSNCTSCAATYFLENSSKTCVPCPNFCSECSNSTICKKCISDINFKLVNDSCQLVCPSIGYFLNETLQKCISCSNDCLICSSSTKCERCKKNFMLINNVCSKSCGKSQLFLNNTCNNCSNIPGLYSDCNEICGDGIQYTSDPLSCDDGNSISGDGCSSFCKIEQNYICIRNSSFEKSYCYDSRALECKLIMKNSNPNDIYLKFNKELQTNDHYSENIKANILGLERASYNYSISQVSSDSFLLIFLYYVSFQSATLQITINNPLEFHDKNNISFQLNGKINLTYEIILPRFIYLSEEKKKQIEQMTDSTQTASIAVVTFSAAPLALIQAMSIFWCLIDAMQIANFFLLINIDYPANAEMFFNILSASNLKFIPNYFEMIFDLNFTITTVNGVSANIDPVIVAPSRFAKLGLTSSFLKNVGGIFGLLLIVLIFFSTLSLTVKILERRQSKRKISLYIIKLYKLLRYDFIFRIQLTLFLELTFATLLQLRVCSAKEHIYLFGFILSGFSFCYLFYLFYVVLRIVNDEKTINKDKEHIEIYGTLFESLDVEKTIPRNYQPIIIIRKFIFCCILIFFHDYPMVTITLISAIQIISSIILVKFKPFITKTQNVVAVFSEIFLSIVMLMILSIYIIQAKEKEATQINNDLVILQLNLGWALISFCLLVLVLYLLMFGYSQYINYKKAKLVILEVQKKAKLTLQRFKTMILDRSSLKSSSISSNPNKRESNPISDSTNNINREHNDSSYKYPQKFSKFKKEMANKNENDDL